MRVIDDIECIMKDTEMRVDRENTDYIFKGERWA